MSMEIIVLAAGRGSRLGERTESLPKWLLDVAGHTIAERQLEAIDGAVVSTNGQVTSIRVVTGFAASAIENFLAGAGHSHVKTVHNPRYAALNNWYSVLLALQTRRSDIDRVAIINADLFAPANWLERFFVDAATATSESLIAIDLERTLTDESMKVSARTDGGTQVVEAIGKVGVAAPIGEYVGLLMARGNILNEFERSLARFVDDEGFADAWYERGVGLTAAAGTSWRVWATPTSDWVEIDDPSDLSAAVALEQMAER